MPSYNVRVFLLLLPTVLLQLPFSALIVILERVTRSLFVSHTTRDYFRSGARGFTVPGTDIAVDDDPAPTLAFLGVSVLGLLLACLSAAGMWELRRVDGMRGAGQRTWCWGVLTMQAVVLGSSIGVLAWASALQSSQEGANLRTEREYTRETWVCEIGKLYAERQDWAETACGTAKATRFMLIPVAISALLAMVAALFAAKQRGGASWLLRGQGHYGGFQSVYEMGPQGPSPQYQHHAPPQFQPMPSVYHQAGYAPPVYAIPPQGLQPGHYQPGPYQPAPYQPAHQLPKSGSAVETQPVYR